MLLGRVGEIKFDRECDDEFTKLLIADIPGISPEDVKFEQIDPTPYDDIIHLRISCSTKLSETESVGYLGIMKIDLREFYGFDYWVSNGMLYLKLYKARKKDIQQLGFGFCFVPKYSKKLMMWC